LDAAICAPADIDVSVSQYHKQGIPREPVIYLQGRRMARGQVLAIVATMGKGRG
jgi:hypothetical protein